MNTRSVASEDDLLRIIDRHFPRNHPNLALGRGDDCAELLCPQRMAVSTDLFLEDVHFRQRYFTPEEAGYKALAVNLSDLAGAGAVPLGFSVGLMVPVPLPVDVAEGLVRGMARLAAKHDLPLTGGDISRADKLGFCVTIWGGPAKGHFPFLRRGPAREGDILFLLGEPGLARAGLFALEKDGGAARKRFPACCAAHLTPSPLLEEGLRLAAVPGVRLMDLSDGLARDLPRLLGGCGANVRLDPEELHPELLALCAQWNAAAPDKERITPELFAFEGGEEYGLLGACPEEVFPAVKKALAGLSRLRVLGRTNGAGTVITLNGTPFARAGFDHFSTTPQHTQE